MSKDRIKFYSTTDLSCGYHLQNATQILNEFDNNKTYMEVNEIVEFHNIVKFIDNNVFLCNWSTEDRCRYLRTVDCLRPHVGKFFSNITEDNFLSHCQAVEIVFIEDFWHLISCSKAYLRLSERNLQEVFETKGFHLYAVLKQKCIVNHFDQLLKTYILSSNENAELIMNKYLVAAGTKCNEMYFPQSLTGEEKEAFVIQYIKSNEPNPNYLSIIEKAQSSQNFPISDATRLLAKRRYQEWNDALFMAGGGIAGNIRVAFSSDIADAKQLRIKGGDSELTYSLSWIRENLDFPTLLNNFIYLFEYTDKYSRSLHVHQESQVGIFEGIMGLRGRGDYFTGVVFQKSQSISTMEMMGYEKTLSDNGVRLEAVFQWFFTDYIVEEFGVSGFHVSMPSEHSTYLEKCRMVAVEIESILKQFKLLVETGTIDCDLMQMSSSHLFFKDIPSWMPQKYIYGEGEEFRQACYYLFSDQCMLSYNLNFLMNKSEFSNGLDLRNQYLHGTQSVNLENHEQNYAIFLKILALTVIKINEELCVLKGHGVGLQP